MTTRVRVTGLDKALNRLSALPQISRAAARESVNETARRIATVARDRGSAVYNLAPEVVARFIEVSPAPQGETRAHVRLHTGSLPLSAFGARVVEKDVPVHLFGRPRTVIRRLYAIEVALRRDHAVGAVRNSFPSRTRRSGRLPEGEIGFYRRGKARLPLRSLSGFKAFPSKFLRQLRPELEIQARRTMELVFDAAFKTRQSRAPGGAG